MSNQLATADQFDNNIIASVVINGDLSRLTPDQKVQYYQQFCERLGLDPLSQPFKLLRLNGKEILYCDRSGAQQLNKIHRVSHEIRARETVSGCYVVTAQASTPDGRHTESIGAVTIDNLRGDALCNAMMKAETKAKRRATLDLLGLGILDESETDTIPKAQHVPAPGQPDNDQAYGPTATGGKGSTEEHMNDLKTNKFKRKYESDDDLFKTLKLAKEVRDVANLYYINAERVEANPELKQAFTDKKNVLMGMNPKTAAA